MGQRLWVIDHAVAYVEDGHVTLQVDKPTRHLPRDEAFNVADKIWFANQMRQLEVARQRGETKEIPLTDRRRRSSVRMGGGFMITQGTKLVVVRRHLDAPRPGQLCECGGVFEYTPPAPRKDPVDVRNDYVASLLKESQEIALVRGDRLYVPQLAPWPSEQIGFQPPGTLNAYNEIIEKALTDDAAKANVPVRTGVHRKFWMKMLDYQNAVRLEFSYSPPLSVDVTAEIDTSSLECVGVLSLPEDIDSAVVAYLDEEVPALRKKLKDETDEEEKARLLKKLRTAEKELPEARKEATKASLLDDIKELEEELDKARKEATKTSILDKMKQLEEELGGPWREAKEAMEIQDWDCELGWDKEKKEEFAVDRDIYIIDIRTGDVTVWRCVRGQRKRESFTSTLWKELSDIRLGPEGTGGRLATEKLERAMKMHCPFTHLQPLLTL